MANIVVLTGAGISAESGLKTFRAGDGLWEEHPIEDVATIEGFKRNPKLVHCFYNQRRSQLQHTDIFPNEAHHALVRLEQACVKSSHFEDSFLLVTQNVDDLHERCGQEKILHMHGELMKVRCTSCDAVFYSKSETSIHSVCDACQSVGTTRPHIVWFNEMPFYLERIYQALAQATVFMAIGTSGTVYPAAGFSKRALLTGAYTIEVNLEPSFVESFFKKKYYGKATEQVPQVVEELIEQFFSSTSTP